MGAKERPTKGQRWRLFDYNDRDRGICTVVAVEGEMVRLNDGCDSLSDFGKKEGYRYEFVDNGHTPSPPSGAEGVRVGQRRRWIGVAPASNGPFTIEPRKEPHHWRCVYDRGGEWVATSDELASGSTLLTDTATGGPTPPDTMKKRAPGCQCHREEGDSPCNVHGDDVVPPFPKREVSADGKAWINYDRLTDADPFDSYRFRKLDGVVSVTVETPGIRIVGTYEGDAHHDLFEAESTDDYDDARRKLPASPPLPVGESRATLFGGVWNIRGGR